jgi:hypothetical protein
MRVYVESIFPCPASRAWAGVRTSRLLHEVARPLVRFAAVDARRLPERWQTGETVRCRSFLFGFIPLGVRALHFERVDDAHREIQTREHDALVRRWDDLIRVQPERDNATRYSDEIEIDAGLLTPLVWLFAQVFYRHRQRRWRRIARRLANAIT